MRYYGYIRVSTQTQVEKGQGLDTQRDAIISFCTANNIELSGILQDAGISGTVPDRDGLNDLLAALEKGDCVIVLNTSRLWRSDSVKVILHHEFKKMNITVKSIEQPTYDIYTKDPNDFLINSMVELLDQYERMAISAKLAKGRKTKARNGSKACGQAPYGYCWNNSVVVPDFEKAEIVRDIFQMYDKVRSFAAVARICKEKGYLTNAGKDFSKQAIYNIVRNSFYMGTVTHAGVESQGTHEPIIEKELFDKVNS